MSTNKVAELGQSNINEFTIFSNYGKELDIKGGFIELSYYESLMDNTIRSNYTYVDSGFREDRRTEKERGSNEDGDLNLTTGEKAILIMEDGNKTKLNLELRVKVLHTTTDKVGKTINALSLYSKECIFNRCEENYVYKRYDGKIHDHVEKIVRENLKSEKSIDSDIVLNTFNFLGHSQTAFYTINWLAKRSIPDMSGSPAKLAGYFFYETSDGYKFKSIDKLFTLGPKKKYIFNDLHTLPPGYDAKILKNPKFDSTLDLDKILTIGSIANTRIRTFNPYTNEYSETDFSYTNQYQEENNGGLEAPKIAADLGIQDCSTRTITKTLDVGVLNSGKNLKQQLQRKSEVNFDTESITRQSSMRYNNLFSIKLEIIVPADFSLHPGDLVECDIPEISDKDNKIISHKKSGIYMIVDLCHNITRKGSFTKMNLVRESIYKK